MSEFEYNNLLFQISQRLDNINAGKQLLVICRGKLAARNEESIPTFSLFEELEGKGFLSSDRLTVLTAILKGVKEWAFLEEVEKFACKRKEYNNLLEQIIRELDELNDLERLISICRGNITEERRRSIHDVRSLFKELESNDCLGIDCLAIVKEILTQTEKSDLLKEVEEFEQRQSRENDFERRKAKAAAIASSAFDKLVGVFTIKTVLRGIGGGILIASAFKLLRRGSTYDQLVNAINNCVLPAGTKLIEMAEGSVNLKVQAENRLALDSLWRMYKNGTLKARLEALFVTDEMREVAGGEGVEVIVTIDEREYEKARDELITEARDDSMDKEEKRFKYLDQDKYDYIQNYLEQAREQAKDVDTHSVTTDTSDSGIPGPKNTSSEVGTEDISDPISNLCLKDLSTVAMEELACRLQVDPNAQQRFYRAFGLSPEKLSPRMLAELFPYTQVKVLEEVSQELQLYDLAEMLENIKSRSLRPSLPLKEMKKLLNVSGRPSKFYNKAEVFIIEYSDRNAVVDACPNVERIGCFFQALNSQSQIIKLTVKVAGQTENELIALRDRKEKELKDDLDSMKKESVFQEYLEGNEGAYNEYQIMMLRRRALRGYYGRKDELPDLTALSVKDRRLAIKNLLEKVTEEREQRKMKIEEIVEEIEQKEEEMRKHYQGEKEKFQMAVSTVMDNWIRQPKDEDRESTLFVVLHLVSAILCGDKATEFVKTTRGCLEEKLLLIPTTKLIIEDYRDMGDYTISTQETLAVRLAWKKKLDLAMISELLNKRWMTLDLLSILREAQRTLPIKASVISQYEFYPGIFQHPYTFHVYENLSSLPRLRKDEQKSESSDHL